MKPKPLAAIAAAVVVILAGCGSTTAKVGAGAHSTGSHPTSPRPADATSSTAGTVPRTTTTTTAPTTTATTTAPTPSYGSVDRSNPSAVAVAMIEATFTSNTTKDKTPQDATRRSAIWYTPTAAAQLLAQQPTGPVGAQWLAWTAHKAVTAVAVTPNSDPGAPQDTPTVAYRQYAVQVTPHGAGGWTTPPDLYVCFVTLTRTDPSAPWQVATLQTDQ